MTVEEALKAIKTDGITFGESQPGRLAEYFAAIDILKKEITNMAKKAKPEKEAPDDNIRRCPFCGSENVHTYNYMIDYYCVYCEDCHTCGPTATSAIKAAEKWNKRQEDD